VPIKEYLAAISVGIVRGEVMLDLNYEEDSQAEVDMNVVMTGSGQFVELQATGEKTPFNDEQLMKMVGLAARGVRDLIEIQKEVLKPK
jgi:ribonuclease PH